MENKEYLNIYDENENFIGEEDREVVHKEGIWHKTVQCYIYDKNGNVYFQIRKDEDKLYTTSGGHVKAGETLKEAFGREVKEEVGLTLDYEKAIPITKVIWKKDKKKDNEIVYKDRAISHFYMCSFDGNYEDFKFDPAEVKGVVKLNAKKTLELLETNSGEVEGIEITTKNNKNVVENKKYTTSDFLLYDGGMKEKYCTVLRKILES